MSRAGLRSLFLPKAAGFFSLPALPPLFLPIHVFLFCIEAFVLAAHIYILSASGGWALREERGKEKKKRQITSFFFFSLSCNRKHHQKYCKGAELVPS